MKPQALIFDFDGTLAVLNIDFGLMKDEVAALARRMGLDSPFPKGYLLEAVEQVGRHLGDGFKKAALDHIQQMEIAAARDSEPFSFTRPLLARARRQKLRLAIVTRNCGPAVKTVLPDLEELVDAFIPRELAPLPKPHPAQVLAACRALQTDPAASVMVGDHPTDMQAARAAGVFGLGVASGRTPPEELARAGAGLVLPDAAALLESLPDRLG